jgi:VanZ family protein
MRGGWLAVGWAMVAVIVWLSLTPAPPKLDFEQSDKLGHFVGYGVLMFWFSQLYRKWPRVAYGLGFIAMGIGLEFAQGRLGFRSYDVFDMYANSLGVLLGWGVALLVPALLPPARKQRRQEA